MNPNFKSGTKIIHYTSQYNRDDFKSCSRSYYKMKPTNYPSEPVTCPRRCSQSGKKDDMCN